MSISDPWRVVPYEGRGTWILMRGNETLYDVARNMREWDSPEAAKAWAVEHLHGTFEWLQGRCACGDGCGCKA